VVSCDVLVGRFEVGARGRTPYSPNISADRDRARSARRAPLPSSSMCSASAPAIRVGFELESGREHPTRALTADLVKRHTTPQGSSLMR